MEINEGNPIYSLTNSDAIKKIDGEYKLDGDNFPIEVLDSQEVKQNYDFVIFGNTYPALEKSLEIAKTGKTVCLVLSETGFDSTSWILSEHYLNFKEFDSYHINLVNEAFENENITIIRNAKLFTEEENDKRRNLGILKRATFVDEAKCNNCGQCLEVCPVNILDHSRSGLINKHAIFNPWPYQSNHIKYAISKVVPYCQASCAIGMDVRGYIGKLADGKTHDSLEIIQRTNPLPDVCGRVCDHACESTCARGFTDEPLVIRKLKRYATEKEYKSFEQHNRPFISKSISENLYLQTTDDYGKGN